jgi:ribosomal protein L19E
LGAVEQAKQQVFSVNYNVNANPYELAENFQADDTENLRQLVKIQMEMFGTATVQTPEDVRRLLSKFDTRRGVSAGPVVVDYFGPSRVNLGKNVKTLATATRRQRVKQMMEPELIQQQRNHIIKRYKEALKLPVKTSLLPNFLRTKKAKQANKKRYYNRLQALTNELRIFNEYHGLAKKSSYGYDF